MISVMCDDCGVRPANFLLKAVTEDGVREKNLCAVCMAKYQRRIPGLDFSNLAGILSGILESRSAEKTETYDEQTDALTCSGCGATYAEFRKIGRAGCAKCYTDFRKPMESLLLKVHGNLQHTGRMPGGVQNDQSLRMSIDRCKQDLVKAIASEEYEQAAQIRDQIRSLTSQLEEAEKNG